MTNLIHFPKTGGRSPDAVALEQALEREKEMRRFLEKVQAAVEDLAVRIDRVEATHNTTLREIKKLVARRKR